MASLKEYVVGQDSLSERLSKVGRLLWFAAESRLGVTGVPGGKIHANKKYKNGHAQLLIKF